MLDDLVRGSSIMGFIFFLNDSFVPNIESCDTLTLEVYTRYPISNKGNGKKKLQNNHRVHKGNQ
jgi:hypothetical protein